MLDFDVKKLDWGSFSRRRASNEVQAWFHGRPVLRKVENQLLDILSTNNARFDGSPSTKYFKELQTTFSPRTCMCEVSQQSKPVGASH